MSRGEKLMRDLSETILCSVDPGAVAVLLQMNSGIAILQFERHEHDEATAHFAPYFDLVRCEGWRNCFESAFTEPLPKKHIATILITADSVENGVVFPLSEAN